MTELTLRAWLRGQIEDFLKNAAPFPIVLWCDPDHAWRELLETVARDCTFQYWSDDNHELHVRESVLKDAKTNRVIWVPREPDELTYLTVFAIAGVPVWSESLIEALRRFGAKIPRDREARLKSLLPAHARQSIDAPVDAWEDLTASSAAESLLDEQRILEALAKPEETFRLISKDDRFDLFARRVVNDFGLPEPEVSAVTKWQVDATARLLCTEAAELLPGAAPRAPEWIIPAGPKRQAALRLLKSWRSSIDYLAAFDEAVVEADKRVALGAWARGLSGDVAPLSSRAAEDALFRKESEVLSALEEFDPLARRLESMSSFYGKHASAHWGSRGREPLAWGLLSELARAAELLLRYGGAEHRWTSVAEAIEWYTREGWRLDAASEILFREGSKFSGALVRVRSRLQTAYQRHLESLNVVFSELLARFPDSLAKIHYAGSLVDQAITGKDPTALIILDACRYELGCRLAERLNHGEPEPRAKVDFARAPLPSITALGMAFALPIPPDDLRVELEDGAAQPWRVRVKGSTLDLSMAASRREYLKSKLKLRDGALLDVKDILRTAHVKGPKDLGRLVVIWGDEFDSHDGELELTGAEDLLDRYARIVRMLRNAGYSRVVLTTDHGFFTWDAGQQEVDEKPKGKIAWIARRVAVGRSLEHATALALTVSQSDLECRVPRSVNAYRTAGGLGFFHGGATLQELVIPVLVARWPEKAKRIDVVLKPIRDITSLVQRVEVEPGGMFKGAELGATVTSRSIQIKVVDPETGKLVFKAKAPCIVSPGAGPQVLELQPVEGAEAAFDSVLDILVIDNDNEEMLLRQPVRLRVELEDWS